MKRDSWTRYLVAAVLVLLVGAVWALAGESKKMKVEVNSENGQEMTINVNGVTERITLEDLAEGEERILDVGGHEITVKRINDRLTLVHDGEALGHSCGDRHKMVWIGADGEEGDHHSRRVVVMKSGDGEVVDIDVDASAMFVGEGIHGEHDVFVFKGEDGEIDIEALREKYGEDFEECHTDHGAHVMKWVSEEGDGHPIIIKRMGHHGAGDYVTYRCEETGSMLTVKTDENLLEDYIDPVTGCVMKKVEHAGVHVIKIREEIISEDDE